MKQFFTAKYLRRVGIGVGVGLVALLVYWVVTIAPLVSVSVQKAYVLHQINESKRHVISLEAELKSEVDRHAMLQEKRAELDARAIELTNRGVADPRPIKVESSVSTAFRQAGS